MKTDWLEDVIALFDARSVNGAADSRHITQPAFSRRIAAIEEHLGIPLLDRSRRPAVLHKAVRDQEARIRDIVQATRELVLDLRFQGRQERRQVVIGSQHAITTSVGPDLVKHFIGSFDIDIRLRSGNRDECTAMLLAKQSDFSVVYRARYEEDGPSADFIEETVIGEDRFIPVAEVKAAANIRDGRVDDEIAIVSYPNNVFMGQVMTREIYPDLSGSFVLRRKVETALTLASLQMAIAGVGVAWLPFSLARSDLELGRISSLEGVLPATTFKIVVQRLAGKDAQPESAIWHGLTSWGSRPD